MIAAIANRSVNESKKRVIHDRVSKGIQIALQFALRVVAWSNSDEHVKPPNLASHSVFPTHELIGGLVISEVHRLGIPQQLSVRVRSSRTWERRATLPSSTPSVRGPAQSKLEPASGPSFASLNPFFVMTGRTRQHLGRSSVFFRSLFRKHSPRFVPVGQQNSFIANKHDAVGSQEIALLEYGRSRRTQATVVPLYPHGRHLFREPANWRVTTEPSGYESSFTRVETASTLLGAFSFNAR